MKDYIFKSVVLVGPILPLVLSIGILHNKLSLRKCVFIASLLSLGLFCTCVVIPYYFQGYSTMNDVHPGRPLGLTAYPVIGDFAYVYTFAGFGFLWLAVGLVTAVLGEIAENKYTDAFAKAAVTLAFSTLFFEFHNFSSTINTVLE